MRSRINSRVFLKEQLIDSARGKHEDEEGNRKAREEWEAIRIPKWRDIDKYASEKAKYELRMRDNDLQSKGWTREQIEAADRADTAVQEWGEKNREPRGSGFLVNGLRHPAMDT